MTTKKETIFKEGINKEKAMEDLKNIFDMTKRRAELLKQLSAQFNFVPREERNILAAIELDKELYGLHEEIRVLFFEDAHPDGVPTSFIGLVTLYESLAEVQVGLIEPLIKVNSLEA